MKKNFLSVFLLLLFIIIFINITQLAWAFYFYKTSEKQYRETLDQTLRLAAMDYTQWKVEQYNEYIKKNTEIITVPPESNNKNLKDLPLSNTDSTRMEKVITSISNPYRLIYNAERRDPLEFNKEVFTYLFEEQLKKREIDIKFVIDTIHLKNNFGDSRQQNVLNPHYPIKTDAVQLNLFSKVAVISSFKNFYGFVLHKIIFVIIFSLLAIIVGNVFLFYIFKKISQEKEAREIKDDFISNLTHDIKTPIAIVTSALDSLLFHIGLEDKDKVIKYLKTSKKEIDHLNDMVDILMNLALEKQIVSTGRNSVNLKILIDSVLDKYRLFYGVNLIVSYTIGENDKPIFIDKFSIANAISNLIENAIKYSEIPAVLNIFSSVKDKTCIIQIVDRGIGIPIKYQNLVFNKFFRVPNNSYKQGTGLGLYYVRKVIESHNGKIMLESQEGLGTKITIEIPLEE